MEKNIEIAQKFYNLFEGKDLYPKFLSWQWGTWLLLAPIFAISVWYTFNSIFTKQPITNTIINGTLMLIAECAFLLINNKIDSFKNESQNQRFNLQPSNIKTQIQNAKRRELERLLGAKSNSFLEIAKEIAEINNIKKKFAQPNIKFWSSIFQPDAKPRLIAITLGACAITAALINRTIESNAIFQLVDSGEFYLILIFCICLAAIIHFLIYGIRYTFRLTTGKIMEWLLKLGWSQAANKIALNYLVHSLVELYEPNKTTKRPLKPFDSCRYLRTRHH